MEEYMDIIGIGLLRAIHDIAIVIWAGGLYALVLVIGPIAHKMEKPQIAIAIQKRFRVFVLGAVPIIAITGILEARERQTMLGMDLGSVPEYQRLFIIKIVLVVVMLIIALIRQRILFGGDRAPGEPLPQQTMKTAHAMLFANVLLMTAVLVLSGLLTATGQMLILRG